MQQLGYSNNGEEQPVTLFVPLLFDVVLPVAQHSVGVR